MARWGRRSSIGSSAAPARVLGCFAALILWGFLSRDGDVWAEAIFREGAIYRTPLLPGLEVRPEELLGVDRA